MVSVFLPVHTNSKYLTQTLNSIFSQSISDFRIYVYQDQASESVKAIVQDFVLLYPSKISVTDSSINRGVGFWFRVFLSEIGSPFFTMIGHDDIWDQNFLSESLKSLNLSPNASVSFSNVVEIDQDTKQRNERIFSHESFFSANLTASVQAQSLYRKNQLCALGALVNSAVVPLYLQSGHSFEYIQDWHLWMLALLKGDFIFSPKAKVMYRIHESNLSISNLSSLQERLERRLMRIDWLKRAVDRSDFSFAPLLRILASEAENKIQGVYSIFEVIEVLYQAQPDSLASFPRSWARLYLVFGFMKLHSRYSNLFNSNDVEQDLFQGLPLKSVLIIEFVWLRGARISDQTINPYWPIRFHFLKLISTYSYVYAVRRDANVSSINSVLEKALSGSSALQKFLSLLKRKS